MIPAIEDMAGEMPPEMMMITLDKLDAMPSPRIIKTHLPINCLPPKLLDTCKVSI